MNPTVTVQAIFVVTVPRCCIAQVMFYFVFFSTPGRRLLEICRRSTLSAGSAAGARAAGKAQTNVSHLGRIISAPSCSYCKMDKESFLLVAAQIESRLRNPFTSLDLASTIEREVDPISFLRNLDRFLFDPNSTDHTKMDKLVKLRILIALLGLDMTTIMLKNKSRANTRDEEDVSSSSSRIDSVVWDMVTNALQAPDDEEWTRMVAGIVKGKLFYGEQDENNDDVCEYEALLQKNNDRIIQQTVQSCANTTSQPCTETYYYAPMRYHLLDPPILQQCFSELYDDNQYHFTPNRHCELLLVDAKAEQIRAAEEESKESQERKNRTIEEKNKLNGQQQPSIGDGRGSMSSNSIKINSMSKSPSAAAASAALMVRQQRGEKRSSTSNVKSVSTSQGSGNTTSFLRTGLGRGRLAVVSSSSSSTAAATSSSSSSTASRGIGRGMSAAAKAALLQRDKSRGSIGSSTATSAMTNSTIPTTTSVAASSTNMTSSNPSVQDTATTAAAVIATTTTAVHPPPVRGRAAALLAMSSKGRSAKMKVLDAEESKQNLIRIQEANTSIEDSRAQRKRKLMEEAEARGLKKSSVKKI